MNSYQEIVLEQDHYDDGIVVDYATMIRMWSTLDRSVNAFNRNCGFITLRPSKDTAGSKCEPRKDRSR